MWPHWKSSGDGGSSPRPKGILQIYGSVLPRSVPWAVLAAAEAAIMTSLGWDMLDYHNTWHHPYSLHVFGMVLGFTLVMRIQIAYQRFWEGATQCHQAAAKWGDAAMQCFAFDEASADAWSDEAISFRMQIVHFASLMNAVALTNVRQDEEMEVNAINPEDPFLFRPEVGEAEEDGDSTLRAMIAVVAWAILTTPGR